MFDDKSKIKTTLVPIVDLTHGPRDDAMLPEQMVSPTVTVTNENEPIKARLISTFQELALLPLEAVIYFEATTLGDRLRKMFFAENDVIGITPVIMKGYPSAVESASFDQDAWNAPYVGYTELVTEMVTLDRVDKLQREQAGERQKPARKEQLLTRERTRHFDNFTSVDDGEQVDEQIEDEDGSRD